LKELKVLCVCGMGFGTSLMLFMNVQDLGKKYGVKITGEACDLGSYKGRPCDVIVASKEIAEQINEEGIPVVAIKNIIDLNELESQMKSFLEN
jgi:ascorbate PTS system EIIB component